MEALESLVKFRQRMNVIYSDLSVNKVNPVSKEFSLYKSLV